MGRKPKTSPRMRSILHGLNKLPKIMREEEKTRKEAARVERKRLKLEAQEMERKAAEQAREAERAAKAEREQRDAPAVTIRVQAPKAEHLTHTRTDSEGRMKTETILGRDGMPVPAHRAPEKPAPEKPAPEKPAPEKPAEALPSEPWTPGCGRPFTRADAIAAHTRAVNVYRGGETVWDFYRSGNGADIRTDASGVARPAEGRGNLWNRTLKGL